MRNSPIMGIFLGIIVVLLIIIFSLGYQLNKTHALSSQETSLRIKAEENIDALDKELNSVKEDLVDLQVELTESSKLVSQKSKEIEGLELEIRKLEKLKEKLEENIKDALVDQDR